MDGIDPTCIDVHLGPHTVPLRKLRVFQELGHKAVLIIGNYTALVGDPSGRDQTRARLTPAQVETNAVDYLRQAALVVIDIDKTEAAITATGSGADMYLDVLALTSKITTYAKWMLEPRRFHQTREKRHANLLTRVPLSL